MGQFGGREQRVILRLVLDAPIEVLDEPVLPWLSKRDVVPFGPVEVAPGQHRDQGQFRAIVADHHGRTALGGRSRCRVRE